MTIFHLIPVKAFHLRIILFCVLFISIFIICYQNDFTGTFKITIDKSVIVISDSDIDNTNNNLIKKSDVKHILVWTNPERDPIMNLEVDNRAFIKKKCSNNNCYVTSDRNLLGDVREFDVIIFHGRDIELQDLPKVRSRHQKYVFASMESAYNYPICNEIFNDYFNWTWTYRLDSDEEYGYISVWNKSGDIVGPKSEMNWMKLDDMQAIDEDLKRKLSSKKKAAAWFVSHCGTPSKRELVAKKLQQELEKLNLTLDIYGACSQKKCPRKESEKCFNIIESDYYFYLSLENSFCTDYVTEKLLHALQNYAVPIVYGGANYTRFMPEGIYLDATKLSITELANKMADLIENKEKYYNYFKWHNHYSYHDVLESPKSDGYCKLCSLMNNQKVFNQTSGYKNFVDWWSPHEKCLNQKSGN